MMPRREFVAGAAAVSLPWRSLAGLAAADLTDGNLHFAPIATLRQALATKRISSHRRMSPELSFMPMIFACPLMA